MKLVVKNQQGEDLNLEILPEDTFTDVQNRIFENGNIVLDIMKLAKSTRKPFNMSDNVFEYFGIQNHPKPENVTTNLESIASLVSKINTNVKDSQKSSFNDTCSKSTEKEDKCSEVPLKGSVGIDFKLSEEQIKDDEMSNTFQISLENVPFPANLLSEPMPLCRLCAQEIYDDDLAYLHEENSVDRIRVVDKINACLPVSVSLEDKLPKQICSACLFNLESSYSFSCSVTSAEEQLNNLLLSSKTQNMNCPLCCEGYMETVAAENDSEDALTDESRDVSKYDSNYLLSERGEQKTGPTKCNSSDIITPQLPMYKKLPNKKRGRPRKYSDSYEDVKECDLDNEMEPAIKKPKLSKKGRPKGSKNKCSIPKNMDCFICHSKFKDYNDALTHTLSAHCDSANQTYPCPFCQSIVTSELELSEHINTHTNQKEVVIIQCNICEVQCSQASEIHKHTLQAHLTTPTVLYICPLCEERPAESVALVDHIMLDHVLQDHIDLDRKLSVCPICELVFDSEEETKQHLLENHIEKPGSIYICSECNSKLDSQTDYLNHIVENHCTTAIYKLPAYYSCATCTNNFRSHYQLAKHACNAVFDDLFCNDCNRRFPTKARLVFHINTHQLAPSERRCDECLAVFSNEDTFYDHVRFQHEPDDQIQCEECNKVFKNFVSLSMHMRRHQPNRDHECSECGKKFQNAQTLREHAVSHMSVKPYQCHICGAYLARISRLRIHLRSHSVKTSKVSMKAYKCSLCYQLFPNMKAAVKHSESHSTVENIDIEEIEVAFVFRCEFCDAFFHKSNELKDHRTSVHPDPKASNAYTCSICKAPFSTYARVTTHKLSHGINTESLIVPDEVNQRAETFVIPQYFLCHECDKRTLNYTYLSLHRRFQHSSGKPIFTCSICGEKFATSWSLQFHNKKNHNEVYETPKIEENGKLFHCRFCEKPYMSQTTLENHVKRCHTDEPDNFICETCGKTFQFKSALEIHADAHKGLKRFECKICFKRFTHRPGLIRHMKLHSEDDPFICEFCGKKFRDRTERENHRRAHTGERPYMCDICGRTFHTRAVWLDHSRIHLDIRPYQCDICNQTFRRSYALKSHYLIHTGERPNLCPDCGQSFRLKQTLMAHRKKEHCKKESPDKGFVPEEALMVDESSQFVDVNLHSDDLGTVHMTSDDDLLEKNLVHSGMETQINSTEVINHPWKPENKETLTKKHRIIRRTVIKEKLDSISTATDVQPGYSLLLKSSSNKDIHDAVE